MIVTEAAKGAAWLRGLVGEIGFKQDSVVLYCDSHNTIHLPNSQVYHPRTNHIYAWYHKIREWNSLGIFLFQRLKL
jgi:hypothetical protein